MYKGARRRRNMQNIFQKNEKFSTVEPSAMRHSRVALFFHSAYSPDPFATARALVKGPIWTHTSRVYENRSAPLPKMHHQSCLGDTAYEEYKTDSHIHYPTSSDSCKQKMKTISDEPVCTAHPTFLEWSMDEG